MGPVGQRILLCVGSFLFRGLRVVIASGFSGIVQAFRVTAIVRAPLSVGGFCVSILVFFGGASGLLSPPVVNS